MKENAKKALLALVAAIGLFFLVWIVTLIGCAEGNNEFWYRAWKNSVLFILLAAIAYFAVQKWLAEVVLKKAAITISVFFFVVGCYKFGSPMETKDAFSSETGAMEYAYCPVCETKHRSPFYDLDFTFCPKDGARLVKDRDRFNAIAGDYTTHSPLMRMLHEGGRAIQVPANKMATPLSFTLKKGERLRIKAYGKVKGGTIWQLNREIGPEGWQMLPFTDARFLCGGSYMALCVKVGSQTWQECGSECTVEPVEDGASVLLAPNEAQNDLNGKFHQEWFDDNSGSFLVEYHVL